MSDFSNSQNQKNIKVEIPPDLTLFTDERQITIHCFVKGETVLSVSPDTFLFSHSPHRKAFLLFSFGAPIHPATSYGIDQRFTLIFSPLDRACKKFNFIEGKLHTGMFLVADIVRTKEDVYNIELGKG